MALSEAIILELSNSLRYQDFGIHRFGRFELMIYFSDWDDSGSPLKLGVSLDSREGIIVEIEVPLGTSPTQILIDLRTALQRRANENILVLRAFELCPLDNYAWATDPKIIN